MNSKFTKFEEIRSVKRQKTYSSGLDHQAGEELPTMNPATCIHKGLLHEGVRGATGSRFDSKFTEMVHKTTLFAPIERNAVNYIENRRMENQKRDVFLTLNLNVKSIVSKAVISHVHGISGNIVKK